MADDPDFETSAQPTLQQLATFLADELFDVNRLRRVENAMRNAHAEGATIAHAAQVHASPGLADKKASLADTGFDEARKAIGWALAHVVAHLLGIEVPDELFGTQPLRPQDSAIGKAIANTVMGGITAETTELVPGDEAATRFMGMLAHLTIQSWAEGIIVEEITSLHGVMHPIEEISKLGKELINGMGLNRLARVAMRPLAQVLVATPLNWKYQKLFRPNLLSEGEIIKAFLRGDYTGADADEEFARLGYSPRRQDMLVKSAAKRLSLDDAMLLARHGTIGRDFVLQNLRDEGFDEATAQFAITAAETKPFDGFNDNSLGALTRAYVNRDISDAALATFLQSIIVNDDERASFQVAAATERELNVKHLTHAEVIECVELGILPTAFYRDWLTREGYPQDEAFALELRLRAKIDAQTALETHRAELTRQKAADQQRKDDAARAKLAKLDEERRLHRRGSIADLSRAVVRGLISIPRLEEVLTAEYDADTVAILVGLTEDDRQTFVDQQQRAADARKRAELRQVDVGALEQAVLADVLTLPQFRQRLLDLNFSAADADVLTATLTATKTDRDAARAKRAKADQAASAKHIDLGRAERLVRHGAASLAQYDQLLASLDFDEPSRAAMVELLRLEIADDAAAKKIRDDAAAQKLVKGLTLEQMRRAVILQVKTDNEFQAYLIAQGYTSEAQIVLVAELRRDVADAEAARLKREAADRASGVAALPLSRVAQAARLGVITPAAYGARLRALGFTPDDIAIETELLIVEIADTQAARARRDALAQQADAPHVLALAQVERAVKAGTATIGDYRLAAAALYAPDDVDLLVATLQAELGTLEDARARHTTVSGELAARTLSLGELEAAVKAGAVTISAYTAQLVSWGYGADDAQLLTFLLSEKLAAAPAGP